LRGIGAERATAWGRATAEHVAEANDHVLVVPIIESVRAGQNVQELVAVPGVELFFFGPSDFSSTAGYAGQWEGPGVAQQILAAKDTIRAAGKHCGLLATSNANLIERQEQGFRMLGLGIDSGFLLRALQEALATVGHQGMITSSFTVSHTVADR
jgi:2-keto-3-deoxy-L-rhamnonate aldolase RhmA